MLQNSDPLGTVGLSITVSEIYCWEFFLKYLRLTMSIIVHFYPDLQIQGHSLQELDDQACDHFGRNLIKIG